MGVEVDMMNVQIRSLKKSWNTWGCLRSLWGGNAAGREWGWESSSGRHFCGSGRNEGSIYNHLAVWNEMKAGGGGGGQLSLHCHPSVRITWLEPAVIHLWLPLFHLSSLENFSFFVFPPSSCSFLLLNYLFFLLRFILFAFSCSPKECFHTSHLSVTWGINGSDSHSHANCPPPPPQKNKKIKYNTHLYMLLVV